MSKETPINYAEISINKVGSQWKTEDHKKNTAAESPQNILVFISGVHQM